MQERRQHKRQQKNRKEAEIEEPGGSNCGKRRGGPSAPCLPWGTGCCCCFRQWEEES